MKFLRADQYEPLPLPQLFAPKLVSMATGSLQISNMTLFALLMPGALATACQNVMRLVWYCWVMFLAGSPPGFAASAGYSSPGLPQITT